MAGTPEDHLVLPPCSSRVTYHTRLGRFYVYAEKETLFTIIYLLDSYALTS